MIRVLTVIGTRPEAVKLAPVVLELQKHPEFFIPQVCVTAQHREMLDQVLALFEIVPDIDLDLMRPGQSLSELTARIISKMDIVLKENKPDLVLVQGDTTTVMAVSLVAFYNQIFVGHVEAGLRSHDRYSPFPEEINRQLTGVLSNYHFAPTETARQALLAENVCDEHIFVTGNPVIDALHMIVNRPKPKYVQDLLDEAGVSGSNGRKLILVTAHRRENFGERIENICLALKTLVERNSNIVIIYPVHLNPNVQEPVYRLLNGIDRIHLIKPVEYDAMAHLLNAAHIILTDSGGIQEEAPSLGKPVLVMRTETERPEAVESGTAKLVGPFTESIIKETERLLNEELAYKQMARAVNPYGDGNAAKYIVQNCRQIFK